MHVSDQHPAVTLYRLLSFEQVYCIFLFLAAVSLFGTLISQINEIVVSHAEMSKELDSILEAYSAVQPRQVLALCLIARLRLL